MADRLWQNLVAGLDAPGLDHRRPMLIYWHMSHVVKYVQSALRLYIDLLTKAAAELSSCGRPTRRS